VDNIPGVPGVGPKTATDLLQRFGSVAGLLGRLPEVKQEKLQASLRASAAVLERNVKLVRLQDDLPCDFSPENLAEKPGDAERLGQLFARWGFRGMLEALKEQPRLRQVALI
jgi:DNA polymerase-1